MGQQIYQTKGFVRQLERLRRSSRKGVMAVDQAVEIIALLNDETTPLHQRWRKETKFGEQRLSDCRKYDLGGGYRMITVLGDGCLILAWIGSHDQCHYWLEKQLKDPIDPEAVKRAGRVFVGSQEGKGQPLAEESKEDPPEEDPYEAALLERIDQETLRYVFRGLCRENSAVDPGPNQSQP